MIIDDITIEMVLKDGSVEVVSSKDRLVSFSVLYELDNDLEGVNGRISANELSMGLLNTDGRYSLHNELSEIYGKIGNNVIIKIKDKGVLIGTFYVSEWSSPRGGSDVANIRATDRLQVILNSDIDVLDVDKSVILYDYIIDVFNKIGVSSDDLIVDKSLKDKVIKFTISEGLKLSNLLNDIALSYDLYIYVNNDNKIVVRSKDVSGAVVHVLSDSINVYSMSVDEGIVSAYNTLNINYNTLQLSDVIDILSIKELNVVAGLNYTDIYKLEDGNLYDVDVVKIDGSNSVDIDGVVYNKNSIKLLLNNISDEDKLVDVKVRGRVVEYVSVVESKSNEADVSVNGKNALDIDVCFVQNKEDALYLLNKLWGRLNIKHNYLKVNILSNLFNMQLCDICDVDIKSEGFMYKSYIHSIKTSWSGGNTLRCDIGLKRII